MTVIAWDGRYLAADMQATCNTQRMLAKKLITPDQGVCLGITGSYDTFGSLIDWYAYKDKPYPCADSDASTWGRLVVVKDRRLSWYETSRFPSENMDRFNAFGNGRDFALGAMAHGASAEQAVRITCAICNSCGLGVSVYDSFTHDLRHEIF